jgi:hypothetical protein
MENEHATRIDTETMRIFAPVRLLYKAVGAVRTRAANEIVDAQSGQMVPFLV